MHSQCTNIFNLPGEVNDQLTLKSYGQQWRAWARTSFVSQLRSEFEVASRPLNVRHPVRVNNTANRICVSPKILSPASLFRPRKSETYVWSTDLCVCLRQGTWGLTCCDCVSISHLKPLLIILGAEVSLCECVCLCMCLLLSTTLNPVQNR